MSYNPEKIEAGKGPTRTQGPGKASDTVRTMRKVSREQNMGGPSGGPQGTKKGKKGYTRKQKHKGQDTAQSGELTEVDETFRHMNFPLAQNWDDYAEARPCGEGEDPRIGHCNPNTSPPSEPEEIMLEDEYVPEEIMLEDEYVPDDKLINLIESPSEWKQPSPRDRGRDDMSFYDRTTLHGNKISANWGSLVESRPCGDQEKYPEKCGEDSDGSSNYPAIKAPKAPSYPQQTGRPPRPLNDYDRQWHDVAYYLGDTDSYSELKERAEDLGLHGTDTEELVDYLVDEQMPVYEALEILQDHYQEKWEKENPDPYKGTAMFRIAADLSWSTHKPETFEDTGEDGSFPAWGLKSIIDRGVKPHEKPKGDKNINPDTQTQRRKISKKSFKSYSMFEDFNE